MKHTWILVANGSLARIFEAENNNVLKEIAVIEHPEGRLHNQDLVTDRPGRSFESANVTRHAMQPQTSPKAVESGIFAKKLNDHLDAAHKAGKFEKLYIVANPHFLGLLRQTIGSSLQRLIVGEVDKDVTQMLPAEIRKHLPYVL